MGAAQKWPRCCLLGGEHSSRVQLGPSPASPPGDGAFLELFPSSRTAEVDTDLFLGKKKKKHHQFPGTLVFLPPNTANTTGIKITSYNLSMAP